MILSIIIWFLSFRVVIVFVAGQCVHKRKHSFFYFHLIEDGVAYLHANATQHIFLGHYAHLAYLVSCPIHFLNPQGSYLCAKALQPKAYRVLNRPTDSQNQVLEQLWVGKAKVFLKEAEKALVLLANRLERSSCDLLNDFLVCLLVVLAVGVLGYYFKGGALQLEDEAEVGGNNCEFAVLFGFSVEEDLDFFLLQLVEAGGDGQPVGDSAAEHCSIRVEHNRPALDFPLGPVRKSKREICSEEGADAVRLPVPDFALVPPVSEVYDD